MERLSAPVNERAVQSFSAVLLSLAIFIAFLEAPFLHTHRHKATERHPGPVFHFHLGLAHHAGNRPAFQALSPDDDAQSQNWFSLSPTHSTLIGLAAPAMFYSIPAPAINRLAIDAPLQTGHDPPLLIPQNPRPPPA